MAVIEVIGSSDAGALGAVALPEGPLEAGAAAVPWSPATVDVDEAAEAVATRVDSGVAAPLPPRAVRATRKNDARGESRRRKSDARGMWGGRKRREFRPRLNL